jgi:hypothetical protein
MLAFVQYGLKVSHICIANSRVGANISAFIFLSIFHSVYPDSFLSTYRFCKIGKVKDRVLPDHVSANHNTSLFFIATGIT